MDPLPLGVTPGLDDRRMDPLLLGGGAQMIVLVAGSTQNKRSCFFRPEALYIAATLPATIVLCAAWATGSANDADAIGGVAGGTPGTVREDAVTVAGDGLGTPGATGAGADGSVVGATARLDARCSCLTTRVLSLPRFT